jgi:phosphatidylinositol 3-kinase
MYTALLADFTLELKSQHASGAQWAANLERQGALVAQLVELMRRMREGGVKHAVMVERMAEFLAAKGEFAHMCSFGRDAAVPLPVRPEQNFTSIMGERVRVFKSALAPIMLPFVAEAGSTPPIYKVMFKSGDDLRQDQFVIGLISLMDKLFKRVNLDLQLTPYRVLATSPKDGFLEFVPESETVTEIKEHYGGQLGRFFEAREFKKADKQTPQDAVKSPSEIQQTLDNFVKSCAGYCVITYILGVGDRHLENLMITTAGRLVHSDFGFILGRDPKPMQPPFKLSKEMVEAMGGFESRRYEVRPAYFVLHILHACLIVLFWVGAGVQGVLLSGVSDSAQVVESHSQSVQFDARLGHYGFCLQSRAWH